MRILASSVTTLSQNLTKTVNQTTKKLAKTLVITTLLAAPLVSSAVACVHTNTANTINAANNNDANRLNASATNTDPNAPPAVSQVDMPAVKVNTAPVWPDALDIYDARTLLDRGLDLLAGKQYAEASRYFQRLLDEFPQDPSVPLAHYNLAVAQIGTTQYEAALQSIENYLAALPAESAAEDVRDGVFKKGEILAHLEQYEDLAALYDEVLGEKLGAHLPIPEQVEALTDSGIAHFMRGDRTTAEYRFMASRRVYKNASAVDKKISEFFAVQASFYLAELAHLEFRDFHLTIPSQAVLDNMEDAKKPAQPNTQNSKNTNGGDGDTAAETTGPQLNSAFTKQLEEKCQLLLRAQSAFIRTVREGHPGWASASGYKIGEMYEELYQEILELPAPADLTVEQEQIFRQLLHKRVAILLEKAIGTWQSTLEMATRTGAENVWVEETRKSFNRVQAILAAGIDAEIDNNPNALPAPAIGSVTTSDTHLNSAP